MKKKSEIDKRDKCPKCRYKLLRRYIKDPSRIIIAATPVIDNSGRIIYLCNKCGSETSIPEIKIKKKVKIAHAVAQSQSATVS